MIELRNISKQYLKKKHEVKALQDISLNIKANAFTLIKGSSGSGKSTLLFTLAGLITPSSGKVSIFGQSIYEMSSKERQYFLAKELGFVYQSYYLIPYLNTLDNILLVNQTRKIKITKEEVEKWVQKFNLQNRLLHKPSELSEGEKQRVALIRAMITKPKLLLADEPTGNLDPKNTEDVLNYLLQYKKAGGTIVMVTHGNEADKFANQMIYLNKGQINSK